MKMVHCNMTQEMSQHCVSSAAFKLKDYEKGEYSHFKDVAKELKSDFEKKFGGTWHIIVGKSFGSFITAEHNRVLYFFIGSVGFLFFGHG